jgi:nickel-type superoxide dismutase maturation protease
MLPFARFKIEGHSMEPTLRNGQQVLVFKWAYIFIQPKVGDIAVFKKDDKFWIKRIIALKNNGYLFEGDNKNDSLDSRKSGPIKKNELIGKVI